jgi:transcriptional regulator with PAS, ATPase and Fis domain
MARTRTAAHQFVKLIEGSASPLYLLDAQRCITFCNAALCQWFRLSAEQLLGQRCDYLVPSGSSGDRPAPSWLCPPPEAFQGSRCSGKIFARSEHGEVLCRRAEFLPLSGSGSEACGVLVILSHDDSEASGPEDSRRDASLHELLQKLAAELRSPYRLERLVGDSVMMGRVREQVRMAIASRANTVILGPHGSGREQVARTIHSGFHCERAEPLLPLSCGVLDGELLQTTVIAFMRRCADLQPAIVPTILLLDIDQLDIEAQAELLAFFRIPTFRARTLVTAREPLLDLAAEKRFSRELACRLCTLVIQMPSLAERREDIPLLAQQFLEEHNARGGAQLSGFEPDVLDELASLPWAGDLDELAEVVQAACARAGGLRVALSDLPERVRQVKLQAAHPRREEEPIVLEEVLAEVERDLIRKALAQAGGNKSQAARLLGLQRARLLRRLTQLGLEEQRLVWRPVESDEFEETEP